MGSPTTPPTTSMRRRMAVAAAVLVVAAAGIGLFVGGVLEARQQADGTTTIGADTPSTTTDPTASGDNPGPSSSQPTTSSTKATTTSSTITETPGSSTTRSSTTTTDAPLPPPPPTEATLRSGDTGPEVVALQELLRALGYWLGDEDGTYGDLTRQAVLAFQKAEGLHRDGIAGATTLDLLAVAERPVARSDDGAVIEVDLDRQLLLVVRDGEVAWALNASTGSGRSYRNSRGGTSVAVTPQGEYAIDRRIDGDRHAPLGTLYRPAYFHGGIAVHGYSSVPAEPASHGCVRVSNPAMDHLWASDAVTLDTPVWGY